MSVTGADDWLAWVNHDLVKRLLWPARDRRELGGAPAPGELAVHLLDGEGTPIGAPALWQTLLQAAPATLPPAALAEFTGALDSAVAAAAGDDLAGVLALEGAFARLARILKAGPGGGP
jgi:hypothetical protein